jgi:hypothetical protein
MISSSLLRNIEQNIFKKDLLDLSGKKINDEEVLLLVNALKKNTSIKKIKLWANEIGDTGAMLLASIHTVEEMDLAENKISEEGAKVLANAHLKKLIISGNPIGDKGIQFFSDSKNLIELQACSCNITEVGSNIIFEKNNILSKINLSSNALGPQGIKALEFNNTLEEVDLSYCDIGDEGMYCIANNRTLRSLDLSNNNITDQSATILAEHLTLKILNLTQNEVGDGFAKSLIKNNQLQELIISRNQVTSAGLSFLLKSPSLNVISLYDNPMHITTPTEIQNGTFFTSDHQFFIRTSKLEQEREVQKNDSDAEEPVISLKNIPPTTIPLDDSSVQKSPITSQFNNFQQQKPQPTAKRKADEIVSHPDFSDFFHSAKAEDIKLLFESLKENCKEIFRKKQKITPGLKSSASMENS